MYRPSGSGYSFTLLPLYYKVDILCVHLRKTSLHLLVWKEDSNLMFKLHRFIVLSSSERQAMEGALPGTLK